MKKSLLAAGAILFLASTAQATTINPQSGDSVWTIASKLGFGFDGVEGIQIKNADASGGVITINTSGVYIVAENLTNPILINADEVVLNLNGYEVNVTSGTYGIRITAGKKRIIVWNGWLTGNVTRGIWVNSSSSVTTSDIYISSLKIYGFNDSINLTASLGKFENIHVANCHCSPTAIGIQIASQNDVSSMCFIENCTVSPEPGSTPSEGIKLEAPVSGATLHNCHITNCVTSGFSLHGIRLNAGSGTQLYNCSIQRCNSSLNGTNGITFQGSGSLHDCAVDYCTTFSNGTTGILLFSSDSCTISECTTAENGSNGVDLASCDSCYINHCVANNEGSTGFRTSGGADNLLERCIANNCTTNFTIDANDHTAQCKDIKGGVFANEDTVGQPW